MAGGGGSSGFAPGLWVLDIEKVYQGEYWTNRYLLNSADMAAAVTAGQSISNAERAILNDATLITRYRVSDGVPDTDVYQVVNVNQFGSAPLAGQQMLPLFNVVRVDFNTAGGGRPSRKYLRGLLIETNVDFNSLTAAVITNVNTNYVTPLVALAAFVDVDAQEITSGSVYPFVGMRQLRRGSKRKAPATGTPL